jgi:predicted phosphodiesterase
MRDCPDRILFQHQGLRYVVIHGGARQVNRFIWPVTEEAELAEEMDALEQQVGRFDAVLAGHSGIPFIRDINGRRWLNAGVLGKPAHDGTTESNYLVLDDLPVLKRLSYDFESAALAMEKVGLTQGYNDCLRTGYWPSESVLPPELRRRQHA